MLAAKRSDLLPCAENFIGMQIKIKRLGIMALIITNLAHLLQTNTLL
jgi:hypothetical protein